jgi:hypothetical protein
MTVGVTGSPNGEFWPVALRDIAFLLLDGLQRPRPARAPDVALCALGLTGDGRAQPIGMRVATREDEGKWRSLLRDIAAAGLGPRLLLIGCDGHPALLRAIADVFPDVPIQVSVPHRLLALARRVPTEARAACMAEARTIFSAADANEAVSRFRDWRSRWAQVASRAVGSLEADLGLCLTFYRFPAPLWVKIRSVNLVERAFREARRLAPAAPVVESPPPPEPLPAVPAVTVVERPAEETPTAEAAVAEPLAPAARLEPMGPTGAPPFRHEFDFTEAVGPVPAPRPGLGDALRATLELFVAYLWVIFLGLLVGAAVAVAF